MIVYLSFVSCCACCLGVSYDGYDPVSGDKFTIKTANNAYSDGYCIPWTFPLINPGVPFGKHHYLNVSYQYWHVQITNENREMHVKV